MLLLHRLSLIAFYKFYLTLYFALWFIPVVVIMVTIAPIILIAIFEQGC
ncbi:hypothetical protein SAMN04487909_101253 [Aneurinibacillus migulanus]|uniref:Uncharacterized protein n=1 Tax=Aneurinibacillus migulanus TaxID=47500 RepID=A0A1G8H4Y1_ANEMI|nr:hypothetical protein SAMN04487909_101253 [Aneurinibacillus migulanus]